MATSYGPLSPPPFQMPKRRLAGPPTPKRTLGPPTPPKRKLGPPTPKVSSRGASAPAMATVWVDTNGYHPPIVQHPAPQQPSGSVRGAESPRQQISPQSLRSIEQPPTPLGGGRVSTAAPTVTSVQDSPLEAARRAALEEILARPDDQFFGYMPGATQDDPGAGWNFGGQQMQGARRDPYLPGDIYAQHAATGYAQRPMPYTSSQVFGGGDPANGVLGQPAGPAQGPGVQASPSAIAAYILNAWADPQLQANMSPENIAFLRSLT